MLLFEEWFFAVNWDPCLLLYDTSSFGNNLPLLYWLYEIISVCPHSSAIKHVIRKLVGKKLVCLEAEMIWTNCAVSQLAFLVNNHWSTKQATIYVKSKTAIMPSLAIHYIIIIYPGTKSSFLRQWKFLEGHLQFLDLFEPLPSTFAPLTDKYPLLATE